MVRIARKAISDIEKEHTKQQKESDNCGIRTHALSDQRLKLAP